MNKTFKEKKILLPHQYYYPYMHFIDDRATKENREAFLESLKGIHRDVMVYIHYPFCDSRCAFCGFDKKYDLDEIKIYVDQLLKELEFYSQFDFTVKNIHIGGGTPTLIPAEYLTKVLNFVKENFRCEPDMDVNIEGSATSIYKDEIIGFMKDNNITRASVGVQTFNPKLREIFNTKATLEQVELTLDTLRKNNIKVFTDILFGYPDFGIGEAPEVTVKNDIKRAMEFGAAGIDFSHIYPYGNKLAGLVEKLGLPYPSTADLVALMSDCMDYMEEHGYHQETSYGFVKEGRIIIETSYYGGVDDVVDTLAVGSGSFGLIGDYKYRNPQYGGYMNMPVPSFVQIKKLTDEQKENMEIVGFPKVLRLSKAQLDRPGMKERFLPKLEKLIAEGLLVEREHDYVVSKEGRYFIDNIYYYMLEEKEQDILDKNVKIMEYK
ncbi:MAG: radical SAM protein [Lachnospiraceae bacterium]|nr:radical SAM protein [Lachnospiraceae bacterium]